jgi:hypothetical protein
MREENISRRYRRSSQKIRIREGMRQKIFPADTTDLRRKRGFPRYAGGKYFPQISQIFAENQRSRRYAGEQQTGIKFSFKIRDEALR